MNLRDQLLMVSDTYCEATGMSRTRLSTIILGNGKRLDAIVDGADLTTGRYEAALLWFSENWPEGQGAKWPKLVNRPWPVDADCTGVE